MDAATLNLMLGLLIGALLTNILWLVCHVWHPITVPERIDVKAYPKSDRDDDQSEFRFYWPAL